MRIAVFSKADLIGAYNLNTLLPALNDIASSITVYLSDKVFPDERGFHTVDQLTYCERDYPLSTFFPFIDKLSPTGGTGLLSFKQMATRYNISVQVISTPSSDDFKHDFTQFSPDLILSTRHDYKLPKQLLDAASLGAINTHPGKLPSYKGLCAPFWAMQEKKTHSYCTVHKMTEDIDCGEPLAFSQWKLDYSKSLLWNTIQTYQQGLQDMITIISDNDFPQIPPQFLSESAPSRYFSAPKKTDFEAFLQCGNTVISTSEYRHIIEPFMQGLHVDIPYTEQIENAVVHCL